MVADRVHAARRRARDLEDARFGARDRIGASEVAVVT